MILTTGEGFTALTMLITTRLRDMQAYLQHVDLVLQSAGHLSILCLFLTFGRTAKFSGIHLQLMMSSIPLALDCCPLLSTAGVILGIQ